MSTEKENPRLSAPAVKQGRTLAKGMAITLIGASLWGVSGTSMQYLTVSKGVDPALITLMRVLLAGALYLAFLLVRNRMQIRGMFSSWKTMGCMVLFAISLYGNQLSYSETVQATNAGTATVLQMLECILVLAFVCIYSKRLPRGRELAGLVAAFVATMLIATQGNPLVLSMPLNGLVWGLFSAVFSAAYILIPKYLGLFDRFGAIPTVGMGMALTVPFSVVGYAVKGGSIDGLWSTIAALNAFDWFIFVICLVVLGTILGFLAYLYGTAVVGAVRGSLLASVEPISATAMSALFLGTAFSGFDITGMILMCLVVFLLANDE